LPQHQKLLEDPHGKSTKPIPSTPATGPVALLIATRKGAFILKSDARRSAWTIAGPMFFGNIVHHMVLDPRDRQRCWSPRAPDISDRAFSALLIWRDMERIVQAAGVPESSEGQKGRVVDHTFWLTPGHASEPNVWYAGTSPRDSFEPRTAATPGSPFPVSTTIRCTQVDRRRAGRYARWTEAALDQRRSARPPPSLYSHVERRRLRKH
jgi:hypothetical protein